MRHPTRTPQTKQPPYLSPSPPQQKPSLKVMGNPEGPHVLASEWVAVELAKALDMRTFQATIMHADADDFSPNDYPSAKTGPAFATKAEQGKSRQEFFNVGLFLCEPTSNFGDVKILTKLPHLAPFIKNLWIQKEIFGHALSAVEETIRQIYAEHKNNPQGLIDAFNFLFQRYVNEIRVEPLRSIKMLDPRSTFEDLFCRLIAPPTPQYPKSGWCSYPLPKIGPMHMTPYPKSGLCSYPLPKIGLVCLTFAQNQVDVHDAMPKIRPMCIARDPSPSPTLPLLTVASLWSEGGSPHRELAFSAPSPCSEPCERPQGEEMLKSFGGHPVEKGAGKNQIATAISFGLFDRRGNILFCAFGFDNSHNTRSDFLQKDLTELTELDQASLGIVRKIAFR